MSFNTGCQICDRVTTLWSYLQGWAQIACFSEEYQLLLSCWYLPWLIRPWNWRRYVPQKWQLTLYELHGIISQKIIHFITSAVRTLNPTIHVTVFKPFKDHLINCTLNGSWLATMFWYHLGQCQRIKTTVMDTSRMKFVRDGQREDTQANKCDREW
jgi:hypothetical protein